MTFIKNITVAPDTMVNDRSFGARRVVGTPEKLPVRMLTDGEIMQFLPPAGQIFDPYPVEVTSCREIKFCLPGGCNNLNAWAYEARRPENSYFNGEVGGTWACSTEVDGYTIDLIGKPLQNGDWPNVMTRDIDIEERKELSNILEDTRWQDNDHDGDEDGIKEHRDADHGLYVGLNADDDNLNGKQDRDEGNARIDDYRTNNRFYQEDDLQQVLLKTVNVSEDMILKLSIGSLSGTRAKIRVWGDRHRGPNPPLIDEGNVSLTIDIPVKDVPLKDAGTATRIKELWIEGVQLSQEKRDLFLQVWHQIRQEQQLLDNVLDIVDVTVIGPTVQRRATADLTASTRFGCLKHAENVAAVLSQHGKMHSYVFSPRFSTPATLQTQGVIDLDLFSYDLKGKYWTGGASGGFDGTTEFYTTSSQSHVEPKRIVNNVDQEFQTDENGGFYIVERGDLYAEGGWNAPSTVVSIPGGKVVARLFRDLHPRAGIRPPGWMIKPVNVDLDFATIDEVDEDRRGGFICLNNDDDNKNKIRDSDPAENRVVGEDDLVEIKLLKNLAGLTTGNFTLNIVSGGENIKVWADAQRVTPIAIPATWSASSLPESLYLEGFRISSVRHVAVDLSYVNMGEHLACNDTVKATVYRIYDVNVHASDPETGEIASVLPRTDIPKLHFVTARQQNDVVLIARIVPDVQEMRDMITWTTDVPEIALTSPAVGTDEETVKFSSNFDTGKKIPIKVGVQGHYSRDIVAWVVSATGKIDNTPTVVNTFNNTANTSKIAMNTPITFEFSIIPAEMTDTTKDVPDLRGMSSSVPPGGLHWTGDPLSGGANKKWDESRQMRTKISSNSATLDLRKVFNYDQFFDNRPIAYPLDAAEGNDDKATSDESNDPYDPSTLDLLIGNDAPMAFIQNSVGSSGDTYETIMHFREFARINLPSSGAQKWFKISDFLEWRFHFKWIMKDESDPNGDGDHTDATDLNGDGDATDNVWVDDLSVIAHDNAGWE